MARPRPGIDPKALLAGVQGVQQAVDAEEARQRRRIDAALPKHRASAANLAHYLGLRKQDLRRLQMDLAAAGLSSLGHCEGHVRDTLQRLVAWLGGRADAAAGGDGVDPAQAERLLHANTRALFGERPAERHVYIMVTAPEAAEATAAWADDVLRAGADVLRINGAHDSPRDWSAVAATFRDRAQACNRPCRIFVDLPGPKLRGEIRQMEQGVIHLPRRKDRFGRTVAGTHVSLVARHGGGDQVPVPPGWLTALEPGDVLELRDAGGRPREIVVGRREGAAVGAECRRSLFLTGGLPVVWRRAGATMGWGAIGEIPAQPRLLTVRPGDVLLINGSGHCDDPDLPALALEAAPLLGQVQPGERVLLDDGRIVATMETRHADGLLCRVQQTPKSPARLRSGKGIAFPDSHLALPHLPEQDEAALAFALSHADGVGVSFVNSAADVALVGRRIRAAGRASFGMILKLETRGALRNLAAILFEALKYDPVGLMIARGDLAVELTFERLAEMQEELLWFGEACHLPVVWATQVLDSMAHTGLATRAEITDAAMSMRAECVMLNRGPHIAAATRMLSSIIRKMETHQYKKRALHRPLALARSEDQKIGDGSGV
jgi:pyruvate kinase